jgi:putative tricarboxylic transport membrane protein
MLENLFSALLNLAQLEIIVALVGGVVLGYFFGALPGLTSSIGMALLIPFTFTMDPIASIVMLVSIYMAADYAGAIPAILVNAPGQPAAAVTAFDGHPMCERGEVGKALTLSIMSSFFGALVSIVLLVISATFIAGFALAFGPAEYFALAILGLSLVSVLSTGSILRGFIGLFFGLCVVTIGLDPMTGDERYVFHSGLLDGVPFLAALIGLFALSEAFFMLESADEPRKPIKAIPSVRGSFGLALKYWPTLTRSSFIGYFVGAVPGAGSSIASLVSYGVAKRMARDASSFGKGNPEGVVASESANNASVSGALAPLLSLGIPGSASAAVLIGGLMIHGVQPGPLLFSANPQIPYSIFMGLLVALPIMAIIGLAGVRFWVRLTELPRGVIATVLAAVCLLGSYASSNDLFSVGITVFFGIIGYVLRKVDINPAPIVLALVLGYMMESNFRRGLVMSSGDYSFFFSKPISAVLLGLAAMIILWPVIGSIKRIIGSRSDPTGAGPVAQEGLPKSPGTGG